MKKFLDRYLSMNFSSEAVLFREADVAIESLRRALTRISQFASQELPPGDDQKRVIEMANDAIRSVEPE